MAAEMAVGIDLGTANTLAASVNSAGHTEMLRDREGDILMPSVVLFGAERTMVGHEARLCRRGQPHRFAACPKCDIGQPFYRQPIDGLRLPPEVMEACILNKLRNEVLAGGKNCGVVIAVPAHFNEVQRQATATAGEMAGLRVLGILNEPVAAALAFGEHTPLLMQQTPVRLLVYDLGGYTFEATLLEIQAGAIRMVATEALPSLGGHDWDLRLVDLFAERFIREHGCDPRDTPAGLDRLLQLATQTKIALTSRRHTTVAAIHDSRAVQVRVTREEFESATADLLARTVALCDKLLAQAEWGWTDLAETQLVGGATRMPMVAAALTHKRGLPPSDRISAEEAVARGAALYAASLMQFGQASGRLPRFTVTNVSTHSLGIEGVDPSTGKKINKILLPRGTPLPAKATRDFVTRHNRQRAITIKVLEGDDADPRQCITIGRVVLSNLPPDISEEWPVEVTYTYDAQGRITAEARVRYTDREAHLNIVRVGGVSGWRLARWTKLVQAAPGFAAYQEVDRWIKAMDLPPPVTIVSSPDEAVAGAPPGSTSLLQKLLPFTFRRPPHSAPLDTTEVPSA